MVSTNERQRIAVSVLSGLALLALAFPSAAQIYKWVDESGTVHFTDAPPARGGSVEVLPESKPRPRPTEAPAPAADASAPQDEAPREAAEAQELDDDWGDEPEVVEEEVATEIIVENGGSDAAVRRRANSPRNRPGQPIRQPGQRPQRSLQR